MRYLKVLLIVFFILSCFVTFSDQAKRKKKDRSERPQVSIDCGPMTNAESTIEFGNQYFASQDYASAYLCYEQALKFHATHEVALTNAGLALLMQQKPTEALPWIEKALKANPKYAYGYYGLGSAYAALAKWDEAIQAFEKSLEITPNQPQIIPALAETYLRKAITYRDEGRFVEARTFTETSLKLNPANDQAYKTMGLILRRLGLHQLAVEYFEKGMSVSSRDPELVANLGFAYGHMGRNKEAIETLQKAVQMAPNEPGIYIALAHTMEHLDFFVPQAIEAYKTVLRIPQQGSYSPSHAEASLGLLRLDGDTCDWSMRKERMANVMKDAQWQIEAGGGLRPILAPFDSMLFEYPDELTLKLARAYAGAARADLGYAVV